MHISYRKFREAVGAALSLLYLRKKEQIAVPRVAPRVTVTNSRYLSRSVYPGSGLPRADRMIWGWIGTGERTHRSSEPRCSSVIS